MRTKRVLRYYCDHCNKGGLQKRAMADHELICLKNPNRTCKLCLEDNEPLRFEDFRDLFADDEFDPDYPSDDGLIAAEIVKRAGEKQDGVCPACVLSMILQADIETRIEYDYKAERDAFIREGIPEIDYSHMEPYHDGDGECCIGDIHYE